MSLPVLAQHMAGRGRNGDTMLVHMTPGEVHGLHALALAHGGQLTINPETGLPEANFLKKLLPAIAGAALNFFAPGIGTAIGGALGLGGAAGSAIAVGGITGLATGSLQKGLMAGLGAYGGAGLTDALLGGAGVAGAAGALGVEGAATGAGSQAAMLAEQTAGFGGEGLQRLAESASYAKGAAPSLSAAFSAGADAAMKNPGAFLKGAAKPLMYAAAPVLADQMVPTTTRMPEAKPGDTGYIRPFVYDPTTFGQGPQGLQALAPVAANQVRYPAPPFRGANGGIVAFAEGGTVTRGTETMEDVRRLAGNRYAGVPMQADRMVATTTRMPGDTATAAPMTEASQAAYDSLLGLNAYPTTQPGAAPVPASAPTDPFAHYRPVVVDAAPVAVAPTAYDYMTGGGGDAGVSGGGFSSVGVTGAEAASADSGIGGGPGVGGIGEGAAVGVDGPGPSGGVGPGSSGGPDGANGGLVKLAMGGYAQGGYNLGSYSDGGRLLRGPGDGVSDSIPATIGRGQPARLADGEFVIPARIVSEIGNGSTEAGARKLYAMMDRVQRARRKTTGKNKVAANTKAERFLPA